MSDTSGIVSDPSFRGTFNIFTTCVSTLFLCAWTSIHLNITESIFWRKLAYACLMIFAPELTLTVAIVELVFVWRTVREHNSLLAMPEEPSSLIGHFGRWRARVCAWVLSRGLWVWGQPKTKQRQRWTLVEGFFASMKGFVVNVDEQPEFLTLNEIMILDDAEKIPRSPSYTLEIRDKSKVDWLSKIITLFQAMWFVIQCIARTIQHLPLSILELGTLGYVAVTVILYISWLYKPKDVHMPIVLGSIPEHVLFELREHSRKPTPKVDNAPARPASNANTALEGPQPWYSRLRSTWDQSFARLGRLLTIPNTIGPIFWIYLWEISEDSSSHSDVVRALENDASIRMSSSLVYMAVCASFGLWHCVAWNSFFPTDIERLLWRIASFLSLLPGIWLLSAHSTHSILVKLEALGAQRRRWLTTAAWARRMRTDKSESKAAKVVMLSWFCLCVFVRGYLFVEMFLALRRMPDGVFQTVHWTDFFPHV